jgi:vitamin B12 transporter
VTEVLLDEDREVSLYSLAAEWEKSFANNLSAVAGTSWNQQKRDDSSNADEWAYLAGARYSFSDNTRIRGSYARQIRFPTLRDLYEIDRGNPELQPEKTDNLELALQHDLLDGRSTVELVLYQVDAQDFIERGLSGVAENFEELRFRGVELNGSYAASEELRLRMAYTYLDAENRSPDAETSELQNRPEHKLSLRMDYDLATGTRLYGAYMYVAGAVALSRNTPVTTTEVGDYNVFDLGVSQSLWNDRVRLIGRVENLLDEDYQESFGFPQPGRRFYVGAEFRL